MTCLRPHMDWLWSEASWQLSSALSLLPMSWLSCVMGTSSFLSSYDIVQWPLKRHWEKHWQEVTIVDFQAFIARLQYRAHSTVLRMHSDRRRTRAYDVCMSTNRIETTHSSCQVRVHLSPFLFSELNVLLFFRCGHTSQSLNLELVLSTASLFNSEHTIQFDSFNLSVIAF